MKAENFCYWLQGWFELNKTIDHRECASKETLEMIEKHLGYVFTMGDLSPKVVTIKDTSAIDKLLEEQRLSRLDRIASAGSSIQRGLTSTSIGDTAIC